MLKERVLEITKELVKIYSPTNTAEEQKVEEYLLNLLQGTGNRTVSAGMITVKTVPISSRSARRTERRFYQKYP